MKYSYPYIFLLLLCNISLSQTPVQKVESLPKSQTIIKGRPDDKEIEIQDILKGFELINNDTLVNVKHFRMCWNDKWGNINCVLVQGNKVIPSATNGYFKDIQPGSIITFDDIIATKNQKDYKVPSLMTVAKDQYKSFISLKNPKICHDINLMPLCYSEGTFIFQFKNGSFSGFTTTDSDILYREKEKLLEINYLSKEKQAIQIKLKLNPKSVSCEYNGRESSLNEISQIVSDSTKEKFIIKYGKYSDTLNCEIGNKSFSVRISKNDFHLDKTPWRWEIQEFHGSSRFAITYNWKRNTPQMIIIQDDYLKYGMSIYTTFKTGRKIWQILSSYTELIDGVVTTSPFTQDYHYYYKKSGKLDTKKTKGSISICDCN